MTESNPPGRLLLSKVDRWVVPLGLLGVSVGLPPLMILWGNPDFIKSHGLTIWDLIALVVLTSVLCPAFLFSLSALADRLTGRNWGWRTACLVSCLLFQLPVMRDVSPSVAIPAGLLGAWLEYKVLMEWPRARRAIGILCLTATVVALFGLFLNPDVIQATEPAAESQSREALQFRNKSTPVIMLVFDELPLSVLLNPQGEIDARHFPHLAALASTSTWYRATRSVSGETMQAMPAILQGHRAARGGESLLTLLRESHHCSINAKAVALAPPDGKLELYRVTSTWQDLTTAVLHAWAPHPWLARQLPPIDQGWVNFGFGESRRETALTAFQGIRASSDKPLFFFAHTMLPHGPYRYREGGVLCNPSLLSENVVAPFDSSLSVFFLQAKMTDSLLGEALEQVRRQGLWENSIVIVTADHGRTFEPGARPRSEEGKSGLQTLYVPLFIKQPGQNEKRWVDTEISTLDILPLLISLLDGQHPWTMEGKPPTSASGDSPNLPKLIAVAAEKYAAFDLGFETSVYCTPELAKVWGQAVPQVNQRSQARYSLLTEPELRDVDLTTSTLPLSLEARVQGALEPGAQLAWVLNGVVAAVVKESVTRPRPDSFFVSTPIPKSLLRPGPNAVELMEIQPANTGQPVKWKRLAKLESPDYKLSPDGTLVSGKDGSLPVASTPGGSLRALALARGGWRLVIDSSESGTELLICDQNREIYTVMPANGDSVSQVLTLPPGQKPTDFSVLLGTEKRWIPLAWDTSSPP